MQIADAPAARDRLVQHRTALHLFHVLAEVADGQLLRNGHFAIVGHLFANRHPEQRGLPCPVWPDQPNLLARVQLKVGIYENQLLSVLLLNVGKRNHSKIQR